MIDKSKDAWIERVLGINPRDARAKGRAATDANVDTRALRKAVEACRAAGEAVDAQVGALQGILRQSRDPQLREISEFGMAALSGGNRTRLMVALHELAGNAQPPPALLKRAARVASDFRAHLATDARVRGFDHNPFGVKVAIRATLDPALLQLEATAASLAA